MIIKNFIQGSDEWFKARAGIPTASNFDKIVTMAGKQSAQRQKYLYQLAGERLLGTKEETYQSAAMARGVELEAEARAAYEFINDCEVEEVGLCYKNEFKFFSCSPDGLRQEMKRGLELKCPSLSVHTEYLHKGKLPSTYFQQVHGSIFVTEYDSWDFMSYYPGLPPFIITVKPDEKFTKALELELESFCFELTDITEVLKHGV